ncbi:hypothetical protein ABE871_15185 [Enterococcus gilvus]|nr:hypothetical protein [Enterococcus gilvus]
MIVEISKNDSEKARFLKITGAIICYNSQWRYLSKSKGVKEDDKQKTGR